MSDNESLDPAEIHAQAAALAAHLQRSGVSFLPVANPASVELLADQFAVPEPSSPDPPAVSPPKPPAPAAASKPAMPKTRLETVPAFSTTDGDYDGKALSADDRKAQLQILAEQVSQCTSCEILASCRTQTVFGEGSPQARFLFFGEGPGADEDRSGRPFVGKAGQLLTKMIVACTLDRADCYITNTVKCRPPGNRNPEGDELQNCKAFYQQQLNLIRPEYIVCLGAIAASELLGTKLSVGRLRGKFHQYRGSKVLVTYHPAYLLRNPAAKKAAWEDLQRLMADAGIELPGK
ncbi:Uracil DNA glycosylase superfamily protein [Rubripirellula obstinata]|uniref:Type-4 uracil-DNA glycosylase n=1 Tax=Rubripirellula obstinata TaxID=406547 RepID=A0A5B1CN33_9BACT|nr:uracil-DNA glycosylase [Rubripirellula obstinata]KAA1261772.1 Uracil DNA glycosylase superfamily protein [Rubripirellula obstinata]